MLLYPLKCYWWLSCNTCWISISTWSNKDLGVCLFSIFSPFLTHTLTGCWYNISCMFIHTLSLFIQWSIGHHSYAIAIHSMVHRSVYVRQEWDANELSSVSWFNRFHIDSLRCYWIISLWSCLILSVITPVLIWEHMNHTCKHLAYEHKVHLHMSIRTWSTMSDWCLDPCTHVGGWRRNHSRYLD